MLKGCNKSGNDKQTKKTGSVLLFKFSGIIKVCNECKYSTVFDARDSYNRI